MNPLKSMALKEAWKSRPDYTNGLAGTKFHNSWRAIRFTERGKRAGCCERWYVFKNFCDDMLQSYIDGYALSRIDKSLPFSKDNCVWVPKEYASLGPTIELEYNGEKKLMIEWVMQYQLNHQGVRQRYFKGKNYSAAEILFGKKSQLKKTVRSHQGMPLNDLRAKASKMMAQYRLKDRKRGLVETRLSIEWFIKNVFEKVCAYCSTDQKLGADRKDNSKGHTLDNIVPACYRCNTMRQDHFTHEEMLKIGAFVREHIDAR